MQPKSAQQSGLTAHMDYCRKILKRLWVSKFTQLLCVTLSATPDRGIRPARHWWQVVNTIVAHQTTTSLPNHVSCLQKYYSSVHILYIRVHKTNHNQQCCNFSFNHNTTRKPLTNIDLCNLLGHKATVYTLNTLSKCTCTYWHEWKHA